MPAMIVTRSLGKNYAGSKALDGLELSINAGGPIGLVGPNGAGKTTLYSLLAGFLKPSSGDIEVFGLQPGHADLCGRLAILPQDAPLKRGVAVVRQLRFLAALQGLSSEAAAREAERVLELVGVADVAGKSPEQLSHGLFKRVAIAQCMIAQPELVLLDEPTAGLDPLAAQAVRQMIRQQGQQTTFIVSSHNLDEIQDLCRSVILLDKGKLVKHCSIEELVDSKQYLTVTLSDEPAQNLDTLFADIDGFVAIDSGISGDKRLVIQFDVPNIDQVQIQVMEKLTQAGLSITNFSRGKDLADRVVDIVGENDRVG